jgi:DNA polymerase I-like protein with 3'-5' exonuclease and polymerase domains
VIPALAKAGDYPYDVEREVDDIWVVEDVDELVELLHELWKLSDAGYIFAVDTETDGIDPKKESAAGKGHVVTTQIAWIDTECLEDTQEIVDSIESKSCEVTKVWINCTDPAMLRYLKPWIESEEAKKVLHNVKFDKHAFANHGIRMRGVVGDTLVMSRLQYPERMSHSLDGVIGLVQVLLGEKRLTTLQALGVHKVGKKGGELKSVEYRSMGEYVEDEEMRPYQQVYSCFDVEDTIRIFYVLKAKLEEMEWEDDDRGLWGFWEDDLCRYNDVLWDMERTGVCIDEDVLEYLLKEYLKLQDRLTQNIYEMIGVPINLNSSQQKSWLLYGSGSREFNKSQRKRDGTFTLEGWELPCQEVVEKNQDPWVKARKRDGSWTSGYPSTDGDHLLWTMERSDDEDVKSLIGMIRERQEVTKLISGTLEPVKRNLRERHVTGVREPGEEGSYRYVHGNFSVVARTGRLACVAAWTPVVTSDGDKRIDDVQTGDLVWTHRNRWRRVTHTWIKGVEDMFTVHFADGNVLTCTLSHRLLSSEGKWVTVRDILNECVEVVGEQVCEPGKSKGPIQVLEAVHPSTNCGEAKDDVPERPIRSSGLHSGGGEEGANKSKVFPIQDGEQEPDEREDQGKSPQLERGVRRRAWVPDDNSFGEEEICASCGSNGALRNSENSERDVGTSHKWRQVGQSSRQPGSLYSFRSSPDPQQRGGQSFVAVEKIVCAGSCTVFDITVEEDESYLACGVYSHNSSLPNLQQIPSRTKLGKAIRHAFVCDHGESLIVADYSQLELNILGCYLVLLFDDREYCEQLRAGDIHQATADSLGIPRRVAKIVNFGILYGMSEFKLANDLRIPRKEAAQILEDYYAAYPGVGKYVKWAIAYAREHGTARTLSGRYRQLPNINDVFRSGRFQGMPTGKARADERRAGNTPIQGTAQDIVSKAQLAIADDEELLDYGYVMNGVVHDEIMGRCKAKYREPARARVCYLMENAVTFPEYDGLVQFPVEGHYGHSWGESKDGGHFECPRCSEGAQIITVGKCPECGGEGTISTERAMELFC